MTFIQQTRIEDFFNMDAWPVDFIQFESVSDTLDNFRITSTRIDELGNGLMGVVDLAVKTGTGIRIPGIDGIRFHVTGEMLAGAFDDNDVCVDGLHTAGIAEIECVSNGTAFQSNDRVVIETEDGNELIGVIESSTANQIVLHEGLDSDLDDETKLLNNGQEWTSLKLVMKIYDSGEWEFTIFGTVIQLRFDEELIKPKDPTKDYVTLSAKGEITLKTGFNTYITGFDGLSLEPCYIGNTGIVLSFDNLKLDLSRTRSPDEIIAAGFDESFMGIYSDDVTLEFPDDWPALVPSELTMEKFCIGNKGVGGVAYATWGKMTAYDPQTKTFTGSAKATTLFGMPFAMEEVRIELIQNTLVEARFEGCLAIPFFDDAVRISLSVDNDGDVTLDLNSVSGAALKKLVVKDILEFELESIGFEVEDGVFKAKMGGVITPTWQGNLTFDWPSFDIEELSVDSEGNVNLDGGWINLPEQYALSLGGFKMELTKFGLGTNDDGTRWVGLNGGLNFCKGLSAGASVEGLRVTWDPDDTSSNSMTLEGIGVELDIENVLYLKGKVAFNEDGPVFKGDIKIELRALPNPLTIDAKVIIGKETQSGTPFKYMGIYLDVELPAGIPLGATGMSIYGFAGLFALNMEPDKKESQQWYSVSRGPDSYYHCPPKGVEHVTDKWRAEKGSKAFGAGISLATTVDNGFSLNMKKLFVIVFPGPIIMLQGSASMIKKMPKGDFEGAFGSLLVLDLRADTFLVGIDANFKYPKTGEILEIGASIEAFFDFKDPTNWHLYLGRKSPRSQRIRASILSLFRADTYLMLDHFKLQHGFWAGMDKNWKFGPLKVDLAAWMELGIDVSFSPIAVHGFAWLHADVGLSAFGIGLGIELDALLEIDAAKPFCIHAMFKVVLKVPLLPDPKADVEITWCGPAYPPPLPIPLQEVAISHKKSTATWVLPRRSLTIPLLPVNKESGAIEGGGYIDSKLPPLTTTQLGGDDAVDPTSLSLGVLPDEIPIVPLDSRPRITFNRPVHDTAQIGLNKYPPNPPDETIGDPKTKKGVMKTRYYLDDVVLQKWDGGSWQGCSPLYGTWDPMPQMGAAPRTSSAQTKLWLWSKTPFNHTIHGGAAYDEWLMDPPQLPSHYPCQPIWGDVEICCAFNHHFGNVRAPNELPIVGNRYEAVESTVTEVIGFEGTNLATCPLSPPVTLEATTGQYQDFEYGIVGCETITFQRPARDVRIYPPLPL